MSNIIDSIELGSCIAGPFRMRVVEVTPKMASEMLDLNNGNRRLRGRRVSVMASDMANGDWSLTPQPIILDRARGRLIDGQHRLSAVVESGATVPFLIAIVMRDAVQVQMSVDQHLVRQSSDYLGIAGKRDAMVLAGIASVYQCIVEGQLPWRNQSISNSTKARFALAHDDDLALGVEFYKCLVENPLYTGGMVEPRYPAAIYIAMLPEYRDEYTSFCMAALLGIGREEGTAAATTSAQLMRTLTGQGNSKYPPEHKVRIFVAGWNAHVRGRHTNKFYKVQMGGRFPDVEGVTTPSGKNEPASRLPATAGTF